MQTGLLIAAGGLGMAIAVAHGLIGDRRVVAPMAGAPAPAFRVMRAVMFLSALHWFAAGAVLVAAPWLLPEAARGPATLIVGAVYLSAGVGNFWATRGRHFGWMALAAATALAFAGAMV